MPSEVMEDIEDDIESRHDSYLSAFDASMNGTRSKEDLLDCQVSHIDNYPDDDSDECGTSGNVVDGILGGLADLK